jgi:hypothetical protein
MVPGFLLRQRHCDEIKTRGPVGQMYSAVAATPMLGLVAAAMPGREAVKVLTHPCDLALGQTV